MRRRRSIRLHPSRVFDNAALSRPKNTPVAGQLQLMGDFRLTVMDKNE
jgi:hypothetical protein